MKFIQIFRPGKHTAVDGRVYSFSEADLRAAASAYDPAVLEAPLVVGHPKTDDPAYGWVKSLSFADTLQAEPHQVEPQFAEMVNAGRFKRVSASWYLPDAPANPKPGQLYLKHVGFLGAAAPAVKGLKPASFAGDQTGIVEFADWDAMTTASLFRRLRDWIIAEFGLEKADSVIPDYQITSLEQSAAQPDADSSPSASYSERNPQENAQMKTQQQLEQEAAALKAREEEQARKEAEFAERDKALRASEAAQRRATIGAGIDTLVAQGKLLPVHREGMIELIASLAGTVEFAEGDKKVSKPAADWMREFLSSLPKQVDFSERGGKGLNREDRVQDPSAIAQAALEFQESEAKAGRQINTAQAVAHVVAKSA